MSKKGYVYILTNPGFRDGCVKIGKSACDAKLRSKQLDNTSVPLPFDVYASLKTEKFNEVERILHAIFADLAKARIRNNREFFDIEPAKVLEYLELQASLLEDAELDVPDEISGEDDGKQRSRAYKGKYVVETEEIFYVSRKGIEARMRVAGGDKYVLLKGSQISKVDSNDDIRRRRDEYRDKIKNFVVVDDMEFSNPSLVGSLVAGWPVNGKHYWRTKDDKRLEEFIKYV